MLAVTGRHSGGICSGRRWHDAGQQAIGEFARQRQTTRVECSDVVAGGGRLGGMHGLGHLVAPQRRGVALGTWKRAGAGLAGLVLRQLAHQHILQPDTTTFA
ncbi:hypothetical protein D3C76_1409750 [compost metagenome]